MGEKNFIKAPLKKVSFSGNPLSKGHREKQASPFQLLVIVILVLVILGLGTLIYLLFFPGGRMPLVQNQKTMPIIERLEIEKQLEPVSPKSMERGSRTETATESPPSPPQKNLKEKNMRDIKIYFVKVNSEGLISLKSTIRRVNFRASPLTESIKSLLKGPDSDEMNRDSLSLIPEDSRLLSARVEEGTAWLNFNEAFRFNPLGREGYTAQLKQIVYTATEFPGVKRVQILIEGSIKQYLSGEGFYVGKPLTRDSFKEGWLS